MMVVRVDDGGWLWYNSSIFQLYSFWVGHQPPPTAQHLAHLLLICCGQPSNIMNIARNWHLTNARSFDHHCYNYYNNNNNNNWVERICLSIWTSWNVGCIPKTVEGILITACMNCNTRYMSTHKSREDWLIIYTLYLPFERLNHAVRKLL